MTWKLRFFDSFGSKRFQEALRLLFRRSNAALMDFAMLVKSGA